MNKLFIILFVSLMNCLCLHANTDSLHIKNLESEIQVMQTDIDSLVITIGSLKTELEGINEIYKYFNTPWLLIKNLGLAFLILVMFAFGLWRFFVYLSPQWYTKLIQRLIEKYEEVNTLKARKKILILNSSKATNLNFIESFFNEKEFKQFKSLNIKKYTPPEESYDLFFANNEDDQLSQEILIEYLNKSPHTYMFYLGLPGSWDFKKAPDLNKRVNFANSRSQVYSNLLSTLKYHDLTVPKIKS